ncbi:MAG TPA: hypothetical protein VF602_05175 [Pedobacter sp.]|jgi:hypothetical protein
MKTIYLKITILILFIAPCSHSFAQSTYYDLYLCNTGTAILKPALDPTLGPAISTNDIIKWKSKNVATGVETPYPDQLGSTPNLAITNAIVSALATGVHNFTVTVTYANGGCVGLESDAVTIYKLPTIALAFDNATPGSYCTNSTPLTGITATVTSTVPPGIGFTYTWSAEKSVNSGAYGSVALNTVGADNGSNTATSTFGMTATDVAAYRLTAKAKYFKLTGNSGDLRGDATLCEQTSSNTKIVNVLPRPAKPSIAIE